MATTTKPSKGGLSVSRSGNNIILTWSPIKKCTDQDIRVFANGSRLFQSDLGKSTKKYTYTINRADWYPTAGKKQLTSIGFKLAWKQKGKKESSFSEHKPFTIAVPGVPAYVAPSRDTSTSDTFTYAWDRNSGDGDINTTTKMFTHFYWETCVVENGKNADWNLAKTQKITKVDPTTGNRTTGQPSYGTLGVGSTSVTIVETQADIAARKKRCFRVASVGPAGTSGYRTYDHQLGGSDPIVIQPEQTNNIGSDTTGTSGSINLDIPSGNSGDTIQVQYAITNPKIVTETKADSNIVSSSLSIPDGFNSWTTADTFTGSGVPDRYQFKFPDQIVDNTVLFMRINRIHDDIVSTGVPVLMSNRSKDNESERVIASLSAPTLTSISVDETHKTVTVSVANNSNLDGSFIAVYQDVGNAPKIIGIIPSNGDQTATFPGDWTDDDSPAFGIRCFVADYTPINRKPSGATVYSTPTVYMESSDIIWQNDLVSKAPIITALSKHNPSTAYIAWEWTWDQADSTEITWSDSKIAWKSTQEPSSYILTNTREGERFISGLSAGTYYFRLRFIRHVGETVTYGKYSEIKELVMSSAPMTPSVTLSDEDGVVALTDTIKAYWKYVSTDGTTQGTAWLGEASRASVDSPWAYTELKDISTNTDSHLSFTPEQLGWENGTTHYVCVKVRSASGEASEGWSEPKAITVAPKPVISVSGIGGSSDAIQSVNDSDAGYTYALTKLPIEFSVTGFGADGFCTATIERASTYEIERPDDTHITGFEGETIISKKFDADPSDSSVVNVSIDVDDLIGHLDNSAQYILTVAIKDRYKQTDSVEYPFTVVWDRYSQMPEAEIKIDKERDAAIIKPTAPNTVADGDYCRIYRLSSDKPQLILDHGEFGKTYLDPYPTFGKFGGYRIVYVTKYGDYKTADNVLAVTEYSKTGNDMDIEQYDKFVVSIKFEDSLIEFPGNISLNNSWAKDFQVTRYLGGSIQGDWNPGVQRTGTINGVIPVEYEEETVYGIRMLADYAGVCHIRTPEGSNFYGDIQVKDDREEKMVNRLQKVSLSYTKIDSVEEEIEEIEE